MFCFMLQGYVLLFLFLHFAIHFRIVNIYITILFQCSVYGLVTHSLCIPIIALHYVQCSLISEFSNLYIKITLFVKKL